MGLFDPHSLKSLLTRAHRLEHNGPLLYYLLFLVFSRLVLLPLDGIGGGTTELVSGHSGLESK